MNSLGDLAPWLAIAALGAFHGLNPAMGWLFAVALGLHRRSRAVVIQSLLPILLGHAAAIGMVLFAAVTLGFFVDATLVARVAGAVLIGWALWHALYGHRRRVRVGMQTGLVGLGFWSLLMATAHGAGLMLLPVALPLCLPGPGSELAVVSSLATGLAVIGVHTAAMLAVIAAVSIVVYEWAGIAFLRRGWINLDLVWSIALAACGLILLAG
ncbi:MAG TPA: hypothetical protein VGA77_00955 [Propylenella sp.]